MPLKLPSTEWLPDVAGKRRSPASFLRLSSQLLRSVLLLLLLSETEGEKEGRSRRNRQLVGFDGFRWWRSRKEKDGREKEAGELRKKREEKSRKKGKGDSFCKLSSFWQKCSFDP